MERSRCRVPRGSVTLQLRAFSTTASIRFAVQCSDRMDGVSATDRLHSCFRKPEVLDLTFLNQILYRCRHLFDWHLRINAMLIEEIDGIGVESLERGFGDLLDVLWPAIGPALLGTLEC